MINIFLDMIKEITNKLFTKQALIDGKERRYISSLIKNIIYLNDLKYYLIEFRKMWSEWKNNFSYYPEMPNSKLDTNISELLLNIMDNFRKLRTLMIYDHIDAINKLDFEIGGKINIFQIWHWIAMKNDGNLFNYNRYEKILYIPNYSFLITNTKPISKSSESDIRKAKKFLMDNNYDFVYDDLLTPSEYIPLIRVTSEFEYKEKNYYLKIHIPEEMNYIDDIINYTDEAITDITAIIDGCNLTLKEYIGENKIDIIKYL